MILIEGPDGAGKSTLAALIAERFELSQGQRGTSDRSRLFEVTVPDVYRALNDCIRGTKPPYIWDRMFYSEFVYYPLTGGVCRFSEAQRQHINDLFTLLTFPLIVCLPPVATCMENVAKDTDPKHKKFNDALPEVYIRYVTTMRWMPPHMVVYDYTSEAPDRIYQIVEAYLTRREAREW